eukprot:9451605-Alexandrium_andersonii.AAC.1
MSGRARRGPQWVLTARRPRSPSALGPAVHTMILSAGVRPCLAVRSGPPVLLSAQPRASLAVSRPGPCVETSAAAG